MEKQITMHPRRLARQMARAELNRAGVTGYNKDPRAGWPQGRQRVLGQVARDRRQSRRPAGQAPQKEKP